MSTENYLQIYDDNVVKFTIKQGSENDRWPLTGDYKIDHSNSNTTYLKYENTTSIIEQPSDTMPGAFTMAELAFTRDTNRVFAGNFSNTTGEAQKTVGGSLVGNKYLGFVDSKKLPTNTDAATNGKPLQLSSANSSGLLEEGSKLRCYFHIDDKGSDSKQCEETEDGCWPKQAYYNKKYDAYDGDYMYDIYRNALIIFDHNIQPSIPASNGSQINTNSLPSESTAKNTRHTTPLIPYNGGDAAVKDFTSDMYGDGYVLLYNVIPDGETLTFSEKKFEKTSGINSNNPGNYSQNIIKLKDIPFNKILEKLDGNYFKDSGNGIITLQNISSGGGGGTNISSNSSLYKIYNVKAEKNTIMAADESGYIVANSGISYSNLKTIINTDIPTIKEDIEGLKASSGSSGGVSIEDLNAFKTEVKSLISNAGSFTTGLRIIKEITGESSDENGTYIKPDANGEIDVADFDNSAKNGIISIVSNKTFVAPYSGTLYINACPTNASSTRIASVHVVCVSAVVDPNTGEETGATEETFMGSMLISSLVGNTLCVPLEMGIKYKIYTTNMPNDSLPASTSTSGGWFYSWICFEK